MAIDAGDPTCDSGLAYDIYQQWLEDGRSGFSASPTAAQFDMIQALCWAVAYPVSLAVNYDNTRVCTRLERVASQTLPAATPTRVQFDTVRENAGNGGTTGATAGFTAPRAGLYLVSATVNLTGHAGTGTAILTVETATDSYRIGRVDEPAGYLAVSGSVVVSLDPGASVWIAVYQNTSTAMTIEAAASPTRLNFASFVRLGD